jgi:hypothetical protein
VTSDFEFLTGSWRVDNRRLEERLVGSTAWHQFQNTFDARTCMKGLVSIDDDTFSEPEPYRGMTFRTYNIAADEWSIHWLDSRSLQMDAAPVRGRFDDGRGVFLSHDTWQGVPILCRLIWTVHSKVWADWEQALSTDGGLTWETNWTMRESRVE